MQEKNESNDECRRSWSYRSDGIKISARNDGHQPENLPQVLIYPIVYISKVSYILLSDLEETEKQQEQ